MCGFIGLISDQDIKEGVLKDKLKNATDMIKHRGPTSDGYYDDANVLFGFRRLSIIDLEGGSQPIQYQDGRYVMVFNGEIYNYIEIKSELEQKGYTFGTSSDSEVLLAAYACFGVECLQKLRGMFAFIIWDTKEKSLFGARDMFGIKPLFVSTEGEVTYFASEKKSILAMTANKEIDRKALQYYFAYRYIPEPLTLNKGISKIPAGHYFIKHLNKEIKIEKYWNATFSKDYYKTEDEAIEAIRNVLDDSMKYHIRSDVPVGALLSSGIDSTITTAIAKRYYRDIQTFTIGFDVGEKNETPIAKQSSDALGLSNTAITVDANTFRDALLKVMWHMDDPLADPSAVALYFVTQCASEHVTVIISGEGSDELFTGYKMYRQVHDLRAFKLIPRFLRRWLKRKVAGCPKFKGKNMILNGLTDVEERYVSNTKAFETNDQVRRLVKNYDENVKIEEIVRPYYEAVKGYPDVTKMQYLDINMWMTGNILLKADRMSMANSLELRVPFLDKEVFKVASRINPEWNIKEKTTKRILRKAARGIIPDFVLDRPKLGFPVPLSDWLRGDMKEWAGKLIQEAKVEGYIDKNYALELYEENMSGKADRTKELWSIIVFILWYNDFIEREYK